MCGIFTYLSFRSTYYLDGWDVLQHNLDFEVAAWA